MWSPGLQSLLPLRRVEITAQLSKKCYHQGTLGGVLSGIAIPPQNMTKKFNNPNFVNALNPHVHPSPDAQTVSKQTDMPRSAKRSRKNRKRNRRGDGPATEGAKPCEGGGPRASAPIDIEAFRRSVAFTISPPKHFWRRRGPPSLCESEDSLVVVFEEDEEEQEEEDGSIFASEDEARPSGADEDSNCRGGVKKVRFADDGGLCRVHPMVKWSFAYQAARKGPWEEYARDRERFKLRVAHAESVLKPILQPRHRSDIYEERFALRRRP